MTNGLVPDGSSAALSVDGLSVRYGAITAVRDASLQLDKGETVALLGPNGAGKTSMMLGIMNLVSRTGRVVLDGADVSGLRTESLVRSGLTLCPEGRNVFPKLTVAENLRLGASALRRGAGTGDLSTLFDLFPVLSQRRNQDAGTLSGGEQQMLAMARALASAPDVLLLDEPSLGLAPTIVDRIFETIGRLREIGISILLVEQSIERALEVSNRVYVMSQGSVVFSGTPNEMQGDRHLHDVFFGLAS